MSFEKTNEFKKDLKKLFKKYKSLPDDLFEFKKIVAIFPLGTGKYFTVLTANERIKIVKARLFCRYLKGSSLRVVYAFIEASKKIIFIELFYKGNKERENTVRIKEYLKSKE